MSKTAPESTESQESSENTTPETKPKPKAPARPKKPKERLDRTLVIVESPSKAKTINKYLGKKYVIEASMGHIIDLPKSRLAVDVENRFKPEYITVRGRAKILNKLKKLAGTSRAVLLAADPDREGEAISFHLANALRNENDNIKRIEFNEITKSAVEVAVQHPRDIDQSLVNAQQARRVLDRLVGYNISPLLWKKIKRGLSAGRVQSIALKLICDREEEIEKFNPEEYWTVDAKFKAKNGTLESSLHSVDGKKADITTETQAKEVVDLAANQEFKIGPISTKERKRQPTAPYTTSRLQQDASNKLGFTSQKTMMVAQQLYEGLELGADTVTGLITYMRTDSVRVTPGALDQLREFIPSTYGDRYLSVEPRNYKTSKSAQDAHEAIRPTDVIRTPESIQSFLSKDQYRLYQLIWQKFVSSQMADEVADVTSVDIESSKYLFRTSGRIVKFDGFTTVFSPEEKEKRKKDNILPVIAEGEEVKLLETLPEQHFTQPPPRFSDASMVKVLEESGVGRPSTYAPTIGTLLKRYYVTRLQKALKPTELGKLVNQTMKEHFPRLLDVQFTSRMEEDLDKVATADLNWQDMLEQFYNPFKDTVSHAQENMAEMRNVLDEKTDRVCEKCGRPMVKRIGRNGYFLACSGFPECKNAKAIPLAKCPLCVPGEVVLRATKKGRPFYGCNTYPECNFSTWDRPTGEVCPKCGKMLVEKSSREKGKYVACSSCDYESQAQSA